MIVIRYLSLAILYFLPYLFVKKMLAYPILEFISLETFLEQIMAFKNTQSSSQASSCSTLSIQTVD